MKWLGKIVFGWEGRKEMTVVGFGWMARTGSTKTGAMIMDINVSNIGGRGLSGSHTIVIESFLSFVQLKDR